MKRWRYFALAWVVALAACYGYRPSYGGYSIEAAYVNGRPIAPTNENSSVGIPFRGCQLVVRPYWNSGAMNIGIRFNGCDVGDLFLEDLRILVPHLPAVVQASTTQARNYAQPHFCTRLWLESRAEDLTLPLSI